MNKLGQIAAVSALLSSCAHIPELGKKEDEGFVGLPDLSNESFREMILSTIGEFERSSTNSQSILVGEGEDMDLVSAGTPSNSPKERAATVLLGVLEGGVGALRKAIDEGERDETGPFLRRNFPAPINFSPGNELGKITYVGDAAVDWYDNEASALHSCSVAKLQWPRGITGKDPENFIYVSCVDKNIANGSGGKGHYWAVYANFPNGTDNNVSLGTSSEVYYQLPSQSKEDPFWLTMSGYRNEAPSNTWSSDMKYNRYLAWNNLVVGASVVESPKGDKVSVYAQSDFFDKERCIGVYEYEGKFYRTFYDDQNDNFDPVKNRKPDHSFEREEFEGVRSEGWYCPNEKAAYTMTWAQNSTAQIKADFEALAKKIPTGKTTTEIQDTWKRYFPVPESELYAQ